MKITFDNKNYLVFFQKERHLDKEARLNLIDTFCEIVRGTTYDIEKCSTVGIGRADQYYKDQYNKITGKKFALTRALQDAHAGIEMRKAFWDVFVETFIEPKNELS